MPIGALRIPGRAYQRRNKMLKHTAQYVLAAVLATAFSLPSSAQHNTWQIDSDHSYARLSAGVSADSNFTLGAARVSGTLSLDRKDPVKSILVLDIYPAGTYLPAINPDGKSTIDSLSDVANYTFLSFHSRRATLTRDGK